MRQLQKGFAVLILVFSVSGPAGAQDPSQSPGPSTWEERIAQAMKLTTAYGELGKQLMACLTEASGGTRERPAVKVKLDCAVALGRLKYEPAIPKLLDMISVIDPTVQSSELIVERAYPCIGALAAYRSAAVPQLLHAYLSEATRSREDPLTHGRAAFIRMAIRVGGTEEVAATYARGLAVESGDKNVKRILDNLVSSFRWR